MFWFHCHHQEHGCSPSFPLSFLLFRQMKQGKQIHSLLLNVLSSPHRQNWERSFVFPSAQGTCSAHGGLGTYRRQSGVWASERHGAIDDPVKPSASCWCWFSPYRARDMVNPIFMTLGFSFHSGFHYFHRGAIEFYTISKEWRHVFLVWAHGF